MGKKLAACKDGASRPNHKKGSPKSLSSVSRRDRNELRELLNSGNDERVLSGLKLLESGRCRREDICTQVTRKSQDFLRHLANRWLTKGSTTGEKNFLRYHRLFVRPSLIKRLKNGLLGEHGVLSCVDIDAGSFTMGSPPTEKGRNKNETQALTKLTRPYRMSETVVTQEQWAWVMGTAPWWWQGLSPLVAFMKRQGLDDALPSPPTANGHIPSLVRNCCPSLALSLGPRFPAVCINWFEATLFCELLTDLEHAGGTLPLDEVYALPTEAEWEYACRAGSSTPFSFGATAHGTQEAWCGRGESMVPVHLQWALSEVIPGDGPIEICKKPPNR